jgi:hypothetical protein
LQNIALLQAPPCEKCSLAIAILLIEQDKDVALCLPAEEIPAVVFPLPRFQVRCWKNTQAEDVALFGLTSVARRRALISTLLSTTIKSALCRPP